MSRLTSLLRQVASKDPRLADDLKREVDALPAAGLSGLTSSATSPRRLTCRDGRCAGATRSGAYRSGVGRLLGWTIAYGKLIGLSGRRRDGRRACLGESVPMLTR